MLRAKLHNARVTGSNRDYEGSLEIDRQLMDQVKIAAYEKILVADVDNGNRFETYAIPGDPGSGGIGLNGATTHQSAIGNRLIVFAFCLVPEEHILSHRPMILVLDEQNRPVGPLKEI